MNKNHVLALLQKDYTTVNVTYEKNPLKPVGTIYKYKTRDLTLKENDMVLIPHPTSPECKVTAARVLSIDPEPLIDLDSNISYRWIVQKIDFTAYDLELSREEAAMKMIVNAEREAQKKKILESFLGTDGLSSSVQTLLEGPTPEVASITRQ